MTQEQAVNEWQTLGIDICEVDFNCGGDNMGDADFSFYLKNGKLTTETTQELEDYLFDLMMVKVEFYTNSNGTYIGEKGTVKIELETDDDNTLYFNFTKYSQSEYNETYNIIADVVLTGEEVEYFKNKIARVFGGFEFETQISYNRDFIMSDADEKIEHDLIDKIESVAEETYPDEEGELEDWFEFGTTDEGDYLEELTIDGNILKILVRRSVTTFQDN